MARRASLLARARTAEFASICGHTVLVCGLTSGPRVIDVGANHGEFSRELADRHGGTYTLVEANPQLAAELERTLSFEVVHVAAGADDGTVEFHIAQNDEASSVRELPAASRHAAILERTVMVPQRSLDSLLAKREGVIDLVKLDIEGAELEVLETVSDEGLARIAQMTVEFHSHRSLGLGESPRVERVLDLMRARGFFAIDFSGGTRLDVLFLNRAVLAPTPANLVRWSAARPASWVTYNAARLRRRLRARAGVNP